jgi:nitrogen PTS system EIIA component
MPHTLFTLSEVARYLHLAREDVEKLVRQREIPFELQRDQPVFRRNDVDAWASQRILGMSSRSVKEYHRTAAEKVREVSSRHALMPDLTSPDRILAALACRTKSSVLRTMVEIAERTHHVCDAPELLAAVAAREELCSTALPGGYALLHPRHHEPYMFLDSFLILARCVQPIHAGAQDDEPTDLFFLVCCNSDMIHLHTLARLCTMAQHTAMLSGLRAASTAGEMFEVLCAAEREILPKT